MTENKLIERLAEAMHSIWASWMMWMFEQGGYICEDQNKVRWWTMRPDDYERWYRQADTPYAELSEEEKESDRKVAHEHLDWLIRHIRESRDSWKNCVCKGDSQIEGLQAQNTELLEACKGLLMFTPDPLAIANPDRRHHYRNALKILNAVLSKRETK